jgi:hypothetical protein
LGSTRSAKANGTPVAKLQSDRAVFPGFDYGAHECNDGPKFRLWNFEAGHSGSRKSFADEVPRILVRTATQNNGGTTLSTVPVRPVTGGAVGVEFLLAAALQQEKSEIGNDHGWLGNLG